MKKHLVITIALLLSITLSAQENIDEIVEIHSNITSEVDAEGKAEESPWKYGGNFSLTFNQVSLTNWVAGGQNAISGNSGLLLNANYKNAGNSWDNTLDLVYGLTKQGEDRTIKNEDKIDFSSQYGRKASERWFYSGLLAFKTQFDKGYQSPDDLTIISNFMAPGYFIGSVGMDYRPSASFTLFLSPMTGRLTVVNDEGLSALGAFGVDAGEKTRAELGGFVRVIYNENIWDDKMVIRSKLELFSNYLYKPKNIDVNFELSVNVKLSNYITTSFQLFLLYDDDALAGLQVKETFGVGFSYRF